MNLGYNLYPEDMANYMEADYVQLNPLKMPQNCRRVHYYSTAKKRRVQNVDNELCFQSSKVIGLSNPHLEDISQLPAYFKMSSLSQKQLT